MPSRIHKFLGVIYYSDHTLRSIRTLILKVIELYVKIKYKNKEKYLFPWSENGKKSLIGVPLFPLKEYAYYAQFYSESLVLGNFTVANSDLYKYEIYKAILLKSHSSIKIVFKEDSLLPISLVDNDSIGESIFFDKCYLDIDNNGEKNRLNNLVKNRYNILKFSKGDICNIKSPTDLIVGAPIKTKRTQE